MNNQFKIKDKRILKNGNIAGYVKQNDGSWKWQFIKKTTKGGQNPNNNSNNYSNNNSNNNSANTFIKNLENGYYEVKNSENNETEYLYKFNDCFYICWINNKNVEYVKNDLSYLSDILHQDITKLNNKSIELKIRHKIYDSNNKCFPLQSR